MTFQTPEQVATELQNLRFNVDQSPKWKDYFQIGSLLTNMDRCLAHLQELDKAMVSKLGEQFAATCRPKDFKRYEVDMREGLAKQKAEMYQKRELERIKELNPPKFNSVLSSILFDQEVNFAFNITEEAGPINPPTLLGFVNPQDFIDYLFKAARHFKDPGASIVHGEFTHRLQWWIVYRSTSRA
jgi:hypothetical protein